MYSIKHKLVNKVYKGNYLLNKNHITDLLSQKKTFKVLYAHRGEPTKIEGISENNYLNLDKFPSPSFNSLESRVKFSKFLQKSSINSDERIVILGQSLADMCCAHWRMKLFNLYNVFLYNGNIQNWQQDGLPFQVQGQQESKNDSNLFDFNCNSKQWIKSTKDSQMIRYLNTYRATTYQVIENYQNSDILLDNKTFLDSKDIEQQFRKLGVFVSQPVIMLKNASEQQKANPIEVLLFALDMVKAENWLIDSTDENNQNLYNQNELEQNAWKSFYHNVNKVAQEQKQVA